MFYYSENIFFLPNSILDLIFSFWKMFKGTKNKHWDLKTIVWSKTREWTQQSATDTKTHRNYPSFDKKIITYAGGHCVIPEFRKNKKHKKKWHLMVWDRVRNSVSKIIFFRIRFFTGNSAVEKYGMIVRYAKTSLHFHFRPCSLTVTPMQLRSNPIRLVGLVCPNVGSSHEFDML